MPRKRKPMNAMTALAIADGVYEPRDEAHYIEAYQYLVDNLLVATLPGRIGREAQRLIDEGEVFYRG